MHHIAALGIGVSRQYFPNQARFTFARVKLPDIGFFVLGVRSQLQDEARCLFPTVRRKLNLTHELQSYLTVAGLVWLPVGILVPNQEHQDSDSPWQL